MSGLVLFALWAGLLLLRDRFWLADQRDTDIVPDPPRWPSVVAVVDAGGSIATIGPAVASLVHQTYPGAFRIVLIGGDHATTAAAAAAGDGRFTLDLVTAPSPPPGWNAEAWAIASGIERAGTADYLLLTGPDLLHAPDLVRSLAARAVAGGFVLTSLIPRLRCRSFAEQMLVPASAWFFQLRFPLRRVNRRGPVAAAGRVLLIDRGALAAAAGVAAMREAGFDRMVLAGLLKRRGAIRLLLSDRVEGLRAHLRIGEIGAAIERAPASLALAGIALFVAPPVVALTTTGLDRVAAAAAWTMMAIAAQPMLRRYRASPLWGAAMPLLALVYGWFAFRAPGWRNPREMR